MSYRRQARANAKRAGGRPRLRLAGHTRSREAAQANHLPSPSWNPLSREGAGDYWGQLFPTPAPTSWVHWKQISAGVNIARRLWAARELGRGRLLDQAISGQHRSLVVSIPESW